MYAEIIDYPETARRLTELILARHPHAKTLLEAACGTGAVLAPLRETFDVGGFDISADMLAVAAAKLPGVDLRRADLVDFDWGHKFDTVICVFSAIGYLTEPALIERAYHRLASHLKPDGVLVVEPWFGPDQWLEGRLGTNFVQGEDITVMRMSSSWLEDEGRVSVMDMHHLVGRRGAASHFVERHRMSLVTPAEHLAAFAKAGLEMDHDPEGLIGRGMYVGGLTTGAVE